MRKSIRYWLLLGVLAAPCAALADPIADFYRGRTLDLTVPGSAGGDYDLRARMVSRHLGRHIPGQPQIVVRNMPGGIGIAAGNHLANAAARDGSVLTIVFQNMPVLQAIGAPGIQFDARAFNWIGNTTDGPNVINSWHASGITKIEQVYGQELVVGASGTGSSGYIYPAAMNALLGTKFKIVGGYSTGGVRLALEQGEVDSICGMAIQTHMAVSPQWFERKLVNVLLQFGLEKHKDLLDVPLAVDLLKGEDLEVLELIMIPHEFGRPFVAPPGIPTDRRDALRAAFDATLKDPAFLDDSQRARQSLDPLTGAQIEALIHRAYKASPSAVQRAARILRGPESVDQKR